MESIYGPRLGDLEGWLVDFFLLDPGWGIQKGVWLEIRNGARLRVLESVMVRRSGEKTDGIGLGKCADQVVGGFNGRPDAKRRQNQGCLLICTDKPALKYEICC